MLYERWREIARAHRSEFALADLLSGRHWTFAELADEAECMASLLESMVFPQGAGSEFILAVLRAWRYGKVACPLDASQTLPKPGAIPLRCVHLKTTSASTGPQRLIAFTAEQLAADAENVVATMGLRPDWPNLGVISLAHSYGFSNLVTPLLLHGIPLILADAPLPETVRRAATMAQSITLPAVPAMWRAWQEADAIPQNVRLAISAGAPLPLALEESIFTRAGIKVHNFFGASECGGISYDDSDKPRRDASCAGTPMKSVALSVADDGCLEVRSRAVGQTYLPVPEPTLGGGCFHTSDLVEIKNGRVYLRGRASDQINIAGRKVSPEAIERILIKHPKLLACLVFGVPSRDAERADEIVAVVVSRESEAALRQFALLSMPPWQVPRHWWFVESLQTNPRGKVSRAEWRTSFLSSVSAR